MRHVTALRCSISAREWGMLAQGRGGIPTFLGLSSPARGRNPKEAECVEKHRPSSTNISSMDRGDDIACVTVRGTQFKSTGEKMANKSKTRACRSTHHITPAAQCDSRCEIRSSRTELDAPGGGARGAGAAKGSAAEPKRSVAPGSRPDRCSPGDGMHPDGMWMSRS